MGDPVILSNTSDPFPLIRFVYQLCEIKDLEKRLDLLLVVMEFPGQFEDLAPVS